jgi:hypothetical protein
MDPMPRETELLKRIVERSRGAKIWKIRVELTPDPAWGDAALLLRDFRMSWGELG